MPAADHRFFKSQAEFRRWLTRNHNKADEIVVAFRKKGTPGQGLTYSEALDEALCFGWIDGVRKSLGAEGYTIRFTPRRRGSIWSDVNVKRAKELIAEGQIQPAGLTAFSKRDKSHTRSYSYNLDNAKFDPAVEQAFRSDKEAWEFFHAQPAGYRRQWTWWVVSAKREDTRQKRLDTLIKACAARIRLDPMQSPFKQVPD